MELTEKVLAGLKCCQQCRLDDDEHFYVQECENCPYRAQWTEAHEHCADTLMRDAAALIREQQERIKALEEAHTPRVMTLEAADEADVCWLEIRDSDRLPPCRVNVGKQIFSIRRFDQTPEIGLFDEYGTLYRFWSAWPTDEQRKAAKWE